MGINTSKTVAEQVNEFAFESTFSFISEHSQTIQNSGINLNDITFSGNEYIGCNVSSIQSINSTQASSGTLNENDSISLTNDLSEKAVNKVQQLADQANGWGAIGAFNNQSQTDKVKNAMKTTINTKLSVTTLQSIFLTFNNNNHIVIKDNTYDCSKLPDGVILTEQNIISVTSATLVSNTVVTAVLSNKVVADYLTELDQAAKQHNQGFFEGFGDFFKEAGPYLIAIGVIIIIIVILYIILKAQKPGVANTNNGNHGKHGSHHK
jgi:hypothetical protein